MPFAACHRERASQQRQGRVRPWVGRLLTGSVCDAIGAKASRAVPVIVCGAVWWGMSAAAISVTSGAVVSWYGSARLR